MKKTILIIIALTIGCANETEVRTDYGIQVISEWQHTDHDLIDAKFLDMLECADLDYSVYVDAFSVEIKPVKDTSSLDWCQEPQMGCMAVYRYEDSTIVVNVHLHMLAHMMGHAIARYEYEFFAMGDHSECSIPVYCGDQVDTHYERMAPKVYDSWDVPKLHDCVVE